MKVKLPASIGNFISEFARFYHESRIKTENFRVFRYRVITTLEGYKRSRRIELALTDRPGDILPSMTIEQIKEASDIIPYMHPVDVNSINDLYYLSRDKVVEVKVSGDKIIALTQQGSLTEYNINDQVDLDKISSIRLSYMLGHMQAEKLFKEAYRENNRYKIVRDNIATLQISDQKTNKEILKKPIDILFSGEYNFYSKADIAKIGYICGQMATSI